MGGKTGIELRSRLRSTEGLRPSRSCSPLQLLLPLSTEAVHPRPISEVCQRLLPTASAMGLELYLDLMSQPCRAVYIFAKKNGIPFQLRTIELLKGQQYTDAFAQVNPLRKVPALKDGDFVLAESVAILLYLSRKYKAPDHWYPQDLQTRARVDEYLAWQHTALRSCCTRAMWQKMMFPVFLGQPVPPEMLASTLAELDGCLQMLEDKFLQNQAFLTGPQISVADLVAITELMHDEGLSVLAAKSLRADPNWLRGVSGWKPKWGRASSRRPMKSS
ncbi:glutathione S-transferase theta-3 isoform X2 [Rattus rattus]|uniref:glutathione S-transferase theta-3 isoform X2 n=1 Tax=Rattus rattus TaxID=10117 RepID=UPI0013F394C8|nr:glutathione S-transferase theta-3 isoform X2 [Rattus rattus]